MLLKAEAWHTQSAEQPRRNSHTYAELPSMLKGKRFVIFGLTRLSVRVAEHLLADRADVTVVMGAGTGEALRAGLDPRVECRDLTATPLAEILAEPEFARVECVLALNEDDLENLRVAVHIRRALPDLPVVVRAFDPALADQLEKGLRVRRAFSVSALAAPAFALAAAGHSVLNTLRIGDDETPIVRMTVVQGGPLDGARIVDIKAVHRCAVLAVHSSDAAWTPVSVASETVLRSGDEVLAGGLLADVLRLGVTNSRLLSGHRRPHVPPGGWWARGPHPAGTRFTLLPRLITALTCILLIAIFVFGRAMHLGFIDALYFMVTTATTTGYGDISLMHEPAWLKLFGCIVMLTGGALLGVTVSQLSAVATADRLNEVMGRQASRLSGHIIVTGLGNVGYRVAKLLRDAGMRVVVLDLTQNARFAAAVRARCPVLTGDARLPEDLSRAGVENCAAVIACTNDDLVNIQTALHARRVNPTARIVARAFDEALADRLSGAFEIDAALSASTVAAAAFVGAATDERAFRTIHADTLDFLACRHTLAAPVTAEEIDRWRSRGVRILAWRRPGGPVQPPLSVFPALDAASELVLCGPSHEIRAIVG